MFQSIYWIVNISTNLLNIQYFNISSCVIVRVRVVLKRTLVEHHWLTNTIHLTLKMSSAQVVETSVTNNSSFQNYPQPDDLYYWYSWVQIIYWANISKETKKRTSRICSIDVWRILCAPIFCSCWLEISFKKNRRSDGRIAIISHLLWRKRVLVAKYWIRITVIIRLHPHKAEGIIWKWRFHSENA